MYISDEGANLMIFDMIKSMRRAQRPMNEFDTTYEYPITRETGYDDYHDDDDELMKKMLLMTS